MRTARYIAILAVALSLGACAVHGQGEGTDYKVVRENFTPFGQTAKRIGINDPVPTGYHVETATRAIATR